MKSGLHAQHGCHAHKCSKIFATTLGPIFLKLSMLHQASGEHVREMYTPSNPIFIYKTGVCRGIPIFPIFASKHRLWVLVRITMKCILPNPPLLYSRTGVCRVIAIFLAEAFLTCTHNLCFEGKAMKISNFFYR